MSYPIRARISKKEIWDRFLEYVKKKHGKTWGVIGYELEQAINNHIDPSKKISAQDGGTATIQTFERGVPPTETLFVPFPEKNEDIKVDDLCPSCLKMGVKSKLGSPYTSRGVGRVQVCPKCYRAVKARSSDFRHIASENYQNRLDALVKAFRENSYPLTEGYILSLFNSWGFSVTPRRLRESYIAPLLKRQLIKKVGRSWTWHENLPDIRSF